MPNLAIVPFELPAAPDRPLSQLKRSRKPASAVADSAIVPFEDCASSVPPMRQLKRKPKAGAGDSLTIVPFEDPAASDRTPRQLKRNRKSSGAADSFAIVPFEETPAPVCIWSSRLRFPRITHQEHKRDRRASSGKSLAAQVAAWVEARVAAGVPEEECELPFLTHAPKMVACGLCRRCVYSHDRLKCSVAACRWVFHNSCAKSRFGFYSKRFKCPQHACFVCKTNYNWRCVRCTVASHTKCAPWPDEVFYLTKPGRAAGRAVCWRHSTDWRHEEHPVPTSDVEEAFSRLALPYVDGEFTIDSILKDVMENTTEPAPYVHIKRNLYLMRKKRDCDQSDVGCTNCNSNSTCSEECECRGLSISCSRSCHCSNKCRNRPFRKEKKLKVVKTMSCGWGVEALETLEKGDFVVEYIGEVIDDALCEQRLWDMKRRGDQNFYMCEVQKDFTIDATFKGNSSRFLNHSCDPNCKLEKWQVDGETRVGVFALRSIEAGEPLTYDYRFENFGPIDKCHCGAPSCRGLFGSKKKNTNTKAIQESSEKDSKWGQKRSRTTSRVSKRR